MRMYEAQGREEKTRDFKKRGKVSHEERVHAMKSTARSKIPFPGIKEIKRVELATKWRKYVPVQYQEAMCPLVAEEVLTRQKKEKNERAAKRKAAKRTPGDEHGKKKNKKKSKAEESKNGGTDGDQLDETPTSL